MSEAAAAAAAAADAERERVASGVKFLSIGDPTIQMHGLLLLDTSVLVNLRDLADFRTESSTRVRFFSSLVEIILARVSK